MRSIVDSSLTRPNVDELNCRTRYCVTQKRFISYNCLQEVSGQYIVAVALGESFDLSNIVSDELLAKNYLATCVDEVSEEGLHFVARGKYDDINAKNICEFFVFGDGVVVFWGVNKAEQNFITGLLIKHVISPYKSLLVTEEADSLAFLVVDEGKSRVSKNCFHLDISQHNCGFRDTSSILERYAFSHGMAASVKVGVWESQLSSKAEPLAAIAEALANGVIPWKRHEALRQTGQFAKLRHSINLNCDLLDTDFYWERENLESFYYMAFHHFSINKRLKLLNSRLDYCAELVSIVDRILCDRHASMLEWMIIILIVVEVFFDVWHFSASLDGKSSLKRISIAEE
uniref:DUF155 domain-containing protein n=1 Tax=Syphacia muris TaxID=451379 RepID=A0A0N5AU76_9BILA